MRFQLKHRFDCDAATLWSITEDPEFERRLGEASASDRALVEQRDDDGTRYVRRRITLQRDLPGPMKKVIGGDRITYDQETWRTGDKLVWKIAPQVLGDRFSGEGTTKVRSTGDGCERIIAGDLTVKVPLIGGKMEKRLVDDVSASYERAAQIIRDMLSERAG